MRSRTCYFWGLAGGFSHIRYGRSVDRERDDYIYTIERRYVTGWLPRAMYACILLEGCGGRGEGELGEQRQPTDKLP